MVVGSITLIYSKPCFTKALFSIKNSIKSKKFLVPLSVKHHLVFNSILTYSPRESLFARESVEWKS